MEFLSSLTLFNSDTPLLLEKRILLISYIDELGSISKAAKKVPMSYKSAWDAIDSMNNLSHTPIVSKETGGKGGGGTSLTVYGKNLLETYRILQKEEKRFLNTLKSMTDIDTGTINTIKRLAMQISARNQLSGTVEEIILGKVNAEVFVKLKSGFTLVSVITKNAIENLDLKIGDDVVTIFKSNSVFVSNNNDLKISARNQLKGKIETITSAKINTQITIDLGVNEKVVSVITTSSLDNLGFKVGDEITAIIKSSDVMLGK